MRGDVTLATPPRSAVWAGACLVLLACTTVRPVSGSPGSLRLTILHEGRPVGGSITITYEGGPRSVISSSVRATPTTIEIPPGTVVVRAESPEGAGEQRVTVIAGRTANLTLQLR